MRHSARKVTGIFEFDIDGGVIVRAIIFEGCARKQRQDHGSRQAWKGNRRCRCPWCTDSRTRKWRTTTKLY